MGRLGDLLAVQTFFFGSPLSLTSFLLLSYSDEKACVRALLGTMGTYFLFLRDETDHSKK